MAIKRRDFLIFLGASAGSAALTTIASTNKGFSMPFTNTAQSNLGLTFQPVKLPLPLEISNLSRDKQVDSYKTFEVKDDLILPQGFTYDVIASWGDRLGSDHFGYNNDYLSLVETAPNEGYLTVNFEYISGLPWMQTYQAVLGKNLPFGEVIAAAAKSENEIAAFDLPENDPLKAQIKAISKAALADQGIGVISIKRDADGRWRRTNSRADRRITGISGLEDGKYLQATGPATSVFNKGNKKGYDDGLGSKIIGTFGNCSGGTTPWGTVLSAEENFQDQVTEPVMADGSSLNPKKKPFSIDTKNINGQGNVLGLAGNKYGWMVEVDPAQPDDYGTKHTWLGRYRHEAVAILAVAGKKLAVYSGCDRRGGHLYKFISKGTVNNPKDKANSRLFSEGMLYGAKFNPDGTGRWIPFALNTPINPIRPSEVDGKDGKGMIPLPNPDRAAGGIVKVTNEADIDQYKAKFATLGDLYEGNATEQQGAILIDAHYAGNAIGITATARPEDTDLAPDGSLYITFTSGTPGGDGGADKSIFKGPNGETPYEFGWIMHLMEDSNDPAAMSFKWQILATGGEPATGGLGFANPDNIEIDKNGNVWMVTDMSTEVHNLAIPSRMKDGKPVSQGDLRGLFGNNTIWFIPTSGNNRGNAYPFGIAPMESEATGPFFTPDQQTLFLAIQHPGEEGGMREGMKAEVRKYALKTTDGEEFMQERKVPIGSNWPGMGANDFPKPSVVAIRHQS